MIVEGATYRFAGELVVDAPTELVCGCTRKRIHITTGGSKTTLTSMAVRLHDGRVVIVLPRSIVSEGRHVRLEVTPAEDTRPTKPPPDLVKALRTGGLTLDGLPVHELRQLVSMVREARDPAVRAQRIAAVLERLKPGKR